MDGVERGRDVLVVAGPGDTQDAILSAVAAQELDAEVLTDLERLPRPWRSAGTVLVADDQAERVVARALPHRGGVFLVGADPAELSVWSAPLAAQVIPLPEGGAWLGSVLADGAARARAPVVAVVGGSGGVGASTLAAAIAQVAGERVAPGGSGGSALVDADPTGGGIDLLLGAERTGGWRWPRLSGAEGQLGDLRGYLPVVDGVSVVSMARGPSVDLAREPLAAIVASLRAWHSLVVVDPGRSLAPATREAVRLAGRQLVVVGAGVRGAAAARQTIAVLGLERAELVVRAGHGALSSGLVAEAVGCPVVVRLPDEPGLLAAAERGEPPARGARRQYRRAVGELVADLVGEEPGNG
ncbi:septum site-determining protein Ssd [Propionicimonas sp.]|uniref:septum site-determining protein Ssd n=1 Tax=Propionicimonas sp. TaxID=1955623 RepID=UPI0039E4D836